MQNESLVTLLARLESILGPVPRHIVRRGRFSHKYYTRDGRLFERNRLSHRLEYLKPKRTCLARRLPEADAGMVSFLQLLLQVGMCGTCCASHPSQGLLPVCVVLTRHSGVRGRPS